MGIRFRKSIKIAPGVRMNIGKRGVSSISAGRYNFGSRGIHQNFSIPGTGISYRSKIGGRSRKKSTPKSSRRTKTTSMSVILKLQPDGSIAFTDKKGNPLSDKLIRETKRQNRPN